MGKQAARRADGPAGKGRRKKRKPACNELDRGCAVGNITPPERGLTSKPGLSSRESWTTILAGRQMTADFGLAGAPANGIPLGGSKHIS